MPNLVFNNAIDEDSSSSDEEKEDEKNILLILDKIRLAKSNIEISKKVLVKMHKKILTRETEKKSR